MMHVKLLISRSSSIRRGASSCQTGSKCSIFAKQSWRPSRWVRPGCSSPRSSMVTRPACNFNLTPTIRQRRSRITSTRFYGWTRRQTPPTDWRRLGSMCSRGLSRETALVPPTLSCASRTVTRTCVPTTPRTRLISRVRRVSPSSLSASATRSRTRRSTRSRIRPRIPTNCLCSRHKTSTLCRKSGSVS